MKAFIDDIARSRGFQNLIASAGSFGDMVALMRQSQCPTHMPFDKDDLSSMADAVRRFESRDKKSGQQLLNDYDANVALTNGQKTYVTVLILHELALKELEQEASDDRDRYTIQNHTN